MQVYLKNGRGVRRTEELAPAKLIETEAGDEGSEGPNYGVYACSPNESTTDFTPRTGSRTIDHQWHGTLKIEGSKDND